MQNNTEFHITTNGLIRLYQIKFNTFKKEHKCYNMDILEFLDIQIESLSNLTRLSKSEESELEEMKYMKSLYKGEIN